MHGRNNVVQNIILEISRANNTCQIYIYMWEDKVEILEYLKKISPEDERISAKWLSPAQGRQ
jgi:hypothetical protein